ncbi:MAG: hypothetical protein KAY24_12285, partial [Candidatus Eisenbacteria sp.]|nr:hypothetical protein [Candidatus Eisenbacteria bacterium]
MLRIHPTLSLRSWRLRTFFLIIAGNIRTIEKRVRKFRAWLTRRKGYSQNQDAQKMIEQIDKYWKKLFADPFTVQTPSGPILIQPQRTNNILGQFFRRLKR